MADQSKYLHAWELKSDSKLLRFYYWMYDADPAMPLSFCKLFWAVVAAPLMTVVWLFVYAFRGVAWTIKTAWHRAKPEKPTDRESWVKRVDSDRVGQWFTGVILAIAGAYLLYLAGVAAYYAYGNQHLFVTVILDVLAGLGALVLAVALGWGLAEVGFFGALADKAWNHFLEPMGRFFCAIGRFFASGYYATKYRTCPRVIVKQ